jgi:hypothetical protein
MPMDAHALKKRANRRASSRDRIAETDNGPAMFDPRHVKPTPGVSPDVHPWSSEDSGTNVLVGDEWSQKGRVVETRHHVGADRSGLLALMLLIESRRAARIGSADELVRAPGGDRNAHAAAATAEQIAWPQIAALYLWLARGPRQLARHVQELHSQAPRVTDLRHLPWLRAGHLMPDV